MLCKCGHEIPLKLWCGLYVQSVASPPASLHIPGDTVTHRTVKWPCQQLRDLCVQGNVLFPFPANPAAFLPPFSLLVWAAMQNSLIHSPSPVWSCRWVIWWGMVLGSWSFFPSDAGCRTRPEPPPSPWRAALLSRISPPNWAWGSAEKGQEIKESPKEL